MAVLVSTPVQLFTAWRIFVITESYWMPGLIGSFSLASFGASFFSTETTARARVIANKHKLTHPYFLIFATVTDVLITVTLIYSLSKRRSLDRPMNVLLRKIMRLALQTGSITSFFTLMDAIAVYVWPKTAISFAFDFPIPKLYSNALLSTLNARSKLSRIAADLSPDEMTTFRAQAINTGLFSEEDEDDDNPLFIGRDSSFGMRGSSGPSTGGTRFTKSSSSGPITFAKATSTFGTTGIASTGILEEDERELDPSVVEKGEKRKGLTPSDSSGSVGEMKETVTAPSAAGMTELPVLRVSMARENTSDSVILEHPDGTLAIV